MKLQVLETVIGFVSTDGEEELSTKTENEFTLPETVSSEGSCTHPVARSKEIFSSSQAW
jgi:hypothetical protein